MKAYTLTRLHAYPLTLTLVYTPTTPTTPTTPLSYAVRGALANGQGLPMAGGIGKVGKRGPEALRTLTLVKCVMLC